LVDSGLSFGDFCGRVSTAHYSRICGTVLWAKRLCPNAVLLPPDFLATGLFPRQVHEILQRHTDLEPLSLWEAYLDVSENKPGLLTATSVARTIREQIRTELQLTASAGVAPNKFLAKIASDWKKPSRLVVIQPEDVDAFLLPLPEGGLPGVGKVTEEKLKGFEVHTIADLRRLDLPALESRFGRYVDLARGVEKSKVVPDRPTQSISAEDTFERDVPLTETEPMIRKLTELTWVASPKESRIARTVVLKLKTAEFKILTRSHTVVSSFLLRRTDGDRAFAAGTRCPRTAATVSPGRRRP
jgi:DNA polymerase IV